jgi:hypothetical protein
MHFRLDIEPERHWQQSEYAKQCRHHCGSQIPAGMSFLLGTRFIGHDLKVAISSI